MELKLPQPKCITDANTGKGCTNAEHFGMEMRTLLHPKGIVHRQGRAVKDSDGRRVGFSGEICRKVRHSNLSSRSKNSKASASAKTQRFGRMESATDRKIDRVIISEKTTPWDMEFIPRKLEMKKPVRGIKRP